VVYDTGQMRDVRVRLSRYFVVLAAVWVVAMLWRIYPQFPDTLRIEGRLTSFADYVEDSCRERIGPAAATCLAEAQVTGRRLVAREQGKSVLLIEAPMLAYLLIYLPLGWIIRRLRPGSGSDRVAADRRVAG
jgi:hypothetical protein